MWKRLVAAASMGLAVLMMGTGCSNKTSAERDSLLSQNNSLKSQLAEEKARADAAEARASSSTVVDAAPAPGTDVTPAAPDMGPPPAGSEDLGTGVTKHKNKNGQDVIEISGDVLFDSGKAVLRPAAKKSLDKVAAIIKREYRGQQLRIEGHTDPTPVKSSKWDDNWDLGNGRARAVLLYLIGKGVPKHDMYLASFADNDLKSAKNYAQDRRVDIVVTNSGR